MPNTQRDHFLWLTIWAFLTFVASSCAKEGLEQESKENSDSLAKPTIENNSDSQDAQAQTVNPIPENIYSIQKLNSPSYLTWIEDGPIYADENTKSALCNLPQGVQAIILDTSELFYKIRVDQPALRLKQCPEGTNTGFVAKASPSYSESSAENSNLQVKTLLIDVDLYDSETFITKLCSIAKGTHLLVNLEEQMVQLPVSQFCVSETGFGYFKPNSTAWVQ